MSHLCIINFLNISNIKIIIKIKKSQGRTSKTRQTMSEGIDSFFFVRFNASSNSCEITMLFSNIDLKKKKKKELKSCFALVQTSPFFKFARRFQMFLRYQTKNEGGVSGRIKKELNPVERASDVRNLEQLIIRGKRKNLKSRLETIMLTREAGRSAIPECVPEI